MKKKDNGLFNRKLSFLKSALVSKSSKNSIPDLLDWWDNQKAQNFVKLETADIKELDKWNLIENDGIYPEEKDTFFSIKGIRTFSQSREVSSWDQPIVIPAYISVVGLLLREYDDILHFLVQSLVAPGNQRSIQLGPSIQSSSLKELEADTDNRIFLSKFFIDGGVLEPLFIAKQSEEGARFYHKEILHIIKELPEEEELELPENFTWVTLRQLQYFIHCGEYVSLYLRSLLSCLQ